MNSSTRAWRSLTWVKASAKPERAAISSMTSGRSICGIRAEMADCRAMRLGGRSILSSGLEHQFVTAISAFDPGGRIVGQVGGDLAPGAIQPGSKIAHLRLGIRRPVERATDGQACGVPCLAAQQALPGIGVAHAGRDEHVAPLQPGAEGFEGCEDVGAVVGDPAGVIEGMALPGGTEKFGWRVGHAGFGPVFHTSADSSVQRSPAGRLASRRTWSAAAGRRTACAPAANTAAIPDSAGRRVRDQAVDAGHGGFDVGPGDLLEQGILPSANRKRGVLVGHDALAQSRSMIAAASRSRSERSLDLRCASSAWAKISVASASNSSTASSSAVASRVWNKAARVAVRRGSWSAARLAGLAVRALRASRPSGAAGKSADGATPRPWLRMASMRSRCRSNSVGERRFGAARRSSSVASVASSE